MDSIVFRVGLSLLGIDACDFCVRNCLRRTPGWRVWLDAHMYGAVFFPQKDELSIAQPKHGPTHDPDPCAQAIAKQVRFVRDSSARFFIQACNLTVAIPVFMIVCRGYDGYARPRKWFSDRQDITLVGGYVLSTILNRAARAGKLPHWGLQVWYSIGMCFLSIFFSPGICERETLLKMDAVGVSGRVIMGLAVMDTRLAIIWNGLFTCIVSLTYYFTESACPSMPTARIFYILQFVTLCIITASLRIFEAVFESQARREAEAAVSRSGHLAVSSLLNIMCDAVVELDEALHIVSGHPKLAGMLLLGSARRIEGAPIQQFLSSDEERSLFELRMASASRASAELFHTKMLDGSGSSIDVEVFHVSFQGGAGQLQHIIGVREHTDVPAEARADHLSPTRSGQLEATFFPPESSPPAPDTVLSAASLAALFYGPAAATTMQAPEEQAASSGETMVALAYDALSFEVIGCTSAWARAFRRWPLSPGDSVHSWLEHPDNMSFLLDSNRIVNSLVNGAPCPDVPCALEHTVVLVPKTRGQTLDIEVRATVSVTFSAQDDVDDEDGELVIAFAILTQPRIRTLHVTRRGERGSGCSGKSSLSSTPSSQRGTARVASAKGVIGTAA